MIEQLKLPAANTVEATKKAEIEAMRNYIYRTIRSLNTILETIDKRLNALEKGKKR